MIQCVVCVCVCIVINLPVLKMIKKSERKQLDMHKMQTESLFKLFLLKCPHLLLN